MKRFALLAALMGMSCSLGLAVPEDVEVSCTRDADCVDDEVCAPTGRCVAELETRPIVLLGASARNDGEVELVFSQPLVLDVALDVARYSITPSLTISDVFSRGAATVVLRTDAQALGVAYTVTVNGIIGAGGTFLDDDAASATFLGFGVPADTSPPEALSPTGGGLVVGLEQLLVWTPRVGASSYTVTLASDPACTMVLHEETLAASLSSLQVTLPSTGVFYWCVNADITVAGARGRGTFNATDDAIYVRCAFNDACDLTTGEVGSPNAPFRSIQRATAAAQQYGLHTVRIATRGASAYPELVQVTGEGIDLDGGYALDFSTRDPAANPTTVRFASGALVITDLRTPMLVRGLRLEAVDTQNTIAVLVNSANAVVTFRDMYMSAAGAYPIALAIADSASVVVETSRIVTELGGLTTAVRIQGQSGLRVTNSTVLADEGPDGSYGITSDDEASSIEITSSVVMSGQAIVRTGAAVSTPGRATIRDSRIIARQSSTATGILMGSGTVERSYVVAEGTFAGRGIDVKGAPSLLRSNVIVEASPGINGIGVVLRSPGDCSGVTTVRVVANTVMSSGTGLVLRTGTPIITNNLFYAPTGVVEEPDVVISTDDGDPLSFENNAMIGSTAYIVLGPPGTPQSGAQLTLNAAASINALDGEPCLAGAGRTVRYSGNIIGEDNTGAIFSDIDGIDNLFYELGDDTVYETVDNDFTLRAGGDTVGAYLAGKDATTSTCGDGTQPCEGEATDLAGQPRTVPWSIGAYERD